jgi:hypothetical protein
VHLVRGCSGGGPVSWCAEGLWCASPGCVIVLVGAADPSDNKSEALRRPRSTSRGRPGPRRGCHRPGFAPNRRVDSCCRGCPTAMTVGQACDQWSTPPAMGYPPLRWRRNPPRNLRAAQVAAGWCQQRGPRTPCRAWGQVIPCPGPRPGVQSSDVVSGAANSGDAWTPTPPNRALGRAWVYRGTGGIAQKHPGILRLSVAPGRLGPHVLFVGTPHPAKRPRAAPKPLDPGRSCRSRPGGS